MSDWRPGLFHYSTMCLFLFVLVMQHRFVLIVQFSSENKTSVANKDTKQVPWMKMMMIIHKFLHFLILYFRTISVKLPFPLTAALWRGPSKYFMGAFPSEQRSSLTFQEHTAVSWNMFHFLPLSSLDMFRACILIFIHMESDSKSLCLMFCVVELIQYYLRNTIKEKTFCDFSISGVDVYRL